MAHNNIPDSKHPMSPEEFAMWKAARRSQRQKNLALAGLSTITVAILAMWFLQFKQNITAPLYRQLGFNNNQEIETALQNKNESTQSQQQDEALKNVDTDKDGLSDYDELNIYKTSPYLEDTDSDGISDYDEVAQGTDPNCATGQNCYGSDFLINENTQTSSDYLNLLNENIDAGSSGTGAPTPETVINPADVTPAVIRQVLLESGYDPEILQGISDEDLMASYQEAARLGSEDGIVE